MKTILICLLLVGCGSTPAPTASVPVAIGCLGAVPARPVDQFGVGPHPGEKAAAQAALLDLGAYKKYSTGLEVAMTGCRPKGEILK
jgi:hypothetical protein